MPDVYRPPLAPGEEGRAAGHREPRLAGVEQDPEVLGARGTPRGEGGGSVIAAALIYGALLVLWLAVEADLNAEGKR